jgi:hypothetical protein
VPFSLPIAATCRLRSGRFGPPLALSFFSLFIVLETRKNGDVDPYKQYVWCERFVHAPAVRFRDTNLDGTVDDTLFAATDANFNVTALIDASGNVVADMLLDMIEGKKVEGVILNPELVEGEFGLTLAQVGTEIRGRT